MVPRRRPNVPVRVEVTMGYRKAEDTNGLLGIDASEPAAIKKVAERSKGWRHCLTGTIGLDEQGGPFNL